MEEISEISTDAMKKAISDTSQESDFEAFEKSSLQGKYHKQSYRKAWENLPDFKGWLKGVKGQPNRAFCAFCGVSLFAHRLSLLKHTCTLKHQRAAQKALQKSNGLLSDNAKISVVPSASQASLQHVSTQNVKLNLRPLQQSSSNNVTVTIIQEGAEEPIEIQLDPSIGEEESGTLITDDDDLGLNIVSSVEQQESVSNSEPSLSKGTTMAHSPNFPLSTHVLDTSKGQPVAQLPVSLYRLIDGRWTLVNEGVTNQDGRCSELIQRQEFVAGRYKLHFDTVRYFELDRKETLYPFVEIAFDVHAPSGHYHIPLLLSAFGYSTYRGS